jgi:hypothetical protein
MNHPRASRYLSKAMKRERKSSPTPHATSWRLQMSLWPESLATVSTSRRSVEAFGQVSSLP